MLDMYIVDAFVDGPYSGNPAGVVLLGAPNIVSTAWMQQVASQLRLSETAFVSPPRSGGHRGLRWFTPTMEVDLCGHATLAAARVLIERGDDALAFDTRSGPLTADAVREDDSSSSITVDMPHDHSETPFDLVLVQDAVGGCPVVHAAAGREYVVAELQSVADVAAVVPDLAKVAELDRSGLVVTAADLDGGDVVCRMFAPQSGIDEDPVTGSAWCALAGWWRHRVGDRFSGRQLSSRGGRVQVASVGDRVRLTGRTRLVVSGWLHV